MQAEHQHSIPWQHAPEQQYPVMPPQPPAPQPGVVWLPPVANDRTNFALIGALLIAVSTIFIPQGIANFVGSPLPLFARLGALILFLLLPILMVASGILVFKQQRRWDRVNQRRQMAAAYGSAAGVPLAEPQPFPNIEALPLSFTIKLKRNWLAIFAWFCFLVVIVSSLQANLYSTGNNLSFQEVIVDWITNLSSFWSIDVCLIAFGIVWGSLPQAIEVTAQGLIVRHPKYDWFKTASGPFWKWVIPWSDIRLFAIREGKPGASKMRYELSSPLKVVTFARIVRPRWWSLYRPAQPFGEYNAQMDALLAFISARTGLLLYDVR